MDIPKLIHQIYLSEGDIIHLFRGEWRDSWKKHFPNWKYKLWRKADVDAFLHSRCSGAEIELYDKMEAVGGKIGIVYRADLLRFLILREYGGLYADMDCLCFDNFEFAMEGDIFVQSEASNGKGNILGMHLMASVPNHTFLSNSIKRISDNMDNGKLRNSVKDVLRGTGPIMAWDAYTETKDMLLYNDIDFCKWIHPRNLSVKVDHEISKAMKTENTLTMHISYATWV